MKFELTAATIAKYIALIMAGAAAWFTMENRVSNLEDDIKKYDREQLMIEFRLLQQQSSHNNEDIANVSKVMNQVMLDIQKIKDKLEIQ